MVINGKHNGQLSALKLSCTVTTVASNLPLSPFKVPAVQRAHIAVDRPAAHQLYVAADDS